MAARVATTQWSQVLAARGGSDTEARAALESLCQTYWQPLYAYIRHQDYGPDEARDLTQGFFAELLEKGLLADADPHKGRFRSFLLASLRHFLSHERARSRALERGGDTVTLPLDVAAAEEQYAIERTESSPPEDAFQLRWVLAVVDRAMDRLREESRAAGDEAQFQRLRQYLITAEPHLAYPETASAPGMSEPVINSAAQRFRTRLGQSLRSEIAETVASPVDVDDEVRDLVAKVRPDLGRKATSSPRRSPIHPELHTQSVSRGLRAPETMDGAHASAQCPACGSTLTRDRRTGGLCPACLLELALESPPPMAELEGAGTEDTLTYSRQAFASGRILGRRYRIRSLLGRGGMGEVWRAYDLKLRVDVALKGLRQDLLEDARALEALRQEVRTARQVMSPNVCRVYDLLELDDQEVVSMEYIDGIVLREILQLRGALELSEARDIAVQFLAGLEAIHAVGLVHRDVKPENLMQTRSGRVVVMDFGIAKSLAERRTDTAWGTPAYVAPEQARGEAVDARTDVFSAGVVLAEMVPGDSPWAPVLERARAVEPSQRYGSAAALSRALENATLRVSGAKDVRPYPGLAPFAEADAEYFFGRELEVEAMWRKLRRPHLLALIGPSGTGKSSFLRAGLLPAMPTGWSAIVATPSAGPFEALARLLAGEVSGQHSVVEDFLGFDDPDVAVSLFTRWRHQHQHVLVVVDQFEELFTLNPQDVQEHFAELLARLALESDVHVLLSMRDDFLFHCSSYEALAPIFSEMTALKPLEGMALRRALVEPALKCGYRFEDEALADEMVEEVSDERGALPLLAFTAAGLWEKRDREQGLLTREAYEHIGGVGGALAQHAEATLKKVGQNRIHFVSELFRNLVTAQGTRMARDRDELLSVFSTKRPISEPGDGTHGKPRLKRPAPVPAVPDRQVEAAEEVLNTLIDDRLLTTYEVPTADEEDTAHHRIEVIHESLLTAWPRLVRWRMQDAEGAKLRDELRQAAQMWEQHDRSEDFLWTDTAFREFQLWRERYPGGLSETEEAFAQAMTAHAERRKRRRRAVLAAVISGLLVVLAIVTWSRFEAVAEARRAEAAKLLALAQLRLEDDPTEALAYTTASLELADSEEARVVAVRMLSKAPSALVLDGLGRSGRLPVFSSDGRWLATAGHAEEVLVWSEDGTGPLRLPGHKPSPQGAVDAAWYEDRFLVTGHWTEGRVRIWSIPGGELHREIDFGSKASWQVGIEHLFAEVVEIDTGTGHELRHLRSWRLPDGEIEDLGTVDWTALGSSWSCFDRGGSKWTYGKGNSVFYRPLPVREGVPDHIVGSHENEARFAELPTEPDRLWTEDASTGELRLWDLSTSNAEPLRVFARPKDATEESSFRPDLTGRWISGKAPWGAGEGVRIWDLQALPGSRGLQLRRRARWYASLSSFDPHSRWVVASVERWDQVVFWPLPQNPLSVIEGYRMALYRPLAFSPDSQWVATVWPDRSLRLWPLPGNEQHGVRVLYEGEIPEDVANLTFDPTGQRLAGTGFGPDLFVAHLDRGALQTLEGFTRDHLIQHAAAFSPSGNLVAAGTSYGTGIEKALRIWNLETGEVSVLDLEQTKIQEGNDRESGFEGGISRLAFADESTLYTVGREGTGGLRWDLEAGTWERVVPAGTDQNAWLWLSGDRHQLITAVADARRDCHPGDGQPPILHDLQTGSSRELETFVECPDAFFFGDLDPSLSVYAISTEDGTIKVGRVNGGEPHLLMGHEGMVDSLSISPDGRWIASTGENKTLRLWPMPDLDKPPLHTLPHDELLAILDSLTNLHAVRDPDSSTGWSIEIGPFPGWEEVPTW